MNLDFMPSPAPDRPGLFIRDPYAYTPAMLIIPPPLVECLACFDGEQTELDLRETLVRLTGELDVGEVEKHLVQTLSDAGFLEDEAFELMREARVREFAERPVRAAAHAGSAYPEDADEMRSTLARYMSSDGDAPVSGAGSLIGIAAPHVSPEGGWQSYRAAYRALGPELRDRTFVVLGTSHYGEPERFGLTRKPFVTPLGQTRTDNELVDRLEAQGGDAVSMEDYCLLRAHHRTASHLPPAPLRPGRADPAGAVRFLRAQHL
jgi:MEMO1 family protein